MAGIYKLEIQDSKRDLKQLLKLQKSGLNKKLVQLPCLLKTKQAETVQAAAALLGRG
jgi:hypothetical protein